MNYATDKQTKFIRSLVLKATGKTRAELARTTLVVKAQGQDDLAFRIKADATIDKMQLNVRQASGLISSLLSNSVTVEVR